jgi:hypothetical protein
MPWRTDNEGKFLNALWAREFLSGGLKAVYQDGGQRGRKLVVVVQSLHSALAEWLFDEMVGGLIRPSMDVEVVGLEELGYERVEDLEVWLSSKRRRLPSQPDAP